MTCCEYESLSARRAWIEILTTVLHWCHIRSLSARRAWIEIASAGMKHIVRIVALRKESVDRNCTAAGAGCAGLVALRKESVDRNCRDSMFAGGLLGSLSARRAWIEMRST